MKSGAPAVHEGIGDISVMLIWINEMEVSSFLGRKARQVIQFEMYESNWIFEVPSSVSAPIVHMILTFTSHGPDQLKNRMVEVQAHSNLT